MSTVPRVKTRRAGRVTDTFDRLSKAYRERNPGMETRWVYDPQHRPELSGVMGRMSQGYRRVTASELGDEEFLSILGMKPEEPVRVGDTVLMGVPKAVRDELAEQQKEVTQETIRSIDRRFYAEIESIRESDGRPLDEDRRPRPRGRSIIEERDFSFDYVQKTDGERSEG